MNRKTKKSRKNVLWITDPWAGLDYPDDTALRLMEECAIQKHATYWSSPEQFELTPGELKIHAKQLLKTTHDRNTSEDYHFSTVRTFSPRKFDYIFYRVDPPVGEAYLQPLRILEQFTRGGKTEIVNRPELLALSSEKFEGIETLSRYYPPMVISSHPESLKTFGRREKKTVAKLVHSAQSRDIQLLDWDTPGNISKSLQALEQMTSGFKIPVVLQRYFPNVKQGEIRLWFVDGNLLSQIKKLPAEGEFVINLWKGGRIEAYELNAREKLAAKAIGIHLKKQKIRLAAVDLIDGLIIDFNYTSPALITEMERVLKTNLAKTIIQKLI